MGYETKSMIYAKSLKASLNATGAELKKGSPEAIKAIGTGYTDVKPNTPERNNIEKMTPKPMTADESVTKSLIKKAPETKAEPTKRENRKSAKKGVDSGVLSGLASGSEGIQTGTALGIMVKKIAGAVKGKKGKAKAKAADAVAKAKATSDANIAKGLAITPAPMPIKKADSFRFYEDSGMNKSTPKKSKPSSGDLSKMASGSQERIAEYKKRNWAMDATTGGAVKKSKVVKAKPTGNAATENSLKNQKSIGRPGPSNVGKKVTTIKPKLKKPVPVPVNVNTPKNKKTEEGTRFLSNKWFQEQAENSTFFDPKRLSLEQIKKRQLKQKL